LEEQKREKERVDAMSENERQLVGLIEVIGM
jgi:hypothetical protein